MKWQAISREGSQKILAASIRCRVGGEGLRIAAIAECLRAASYLASAPVAGNGNWEPAASLSLTSMVRRRLSPLWPDLAEDKDARPGVLSVLNSLGELGDLVRLRGGSWLTPPAHAIKAANDSAVILGGGPLETLPHHIQTQAAGRVRLVDAIACNDWIDVWDACEWIGAPVEGLEAWSIRLIATMKSRFSDVPSALGDIAIYDKGRWGALAELPNAGGVFLSKCQTGPVASHFLGDYFRGRIRKMVSLNLQDARRLRFHLDAQAGRPMRVKAVTSQGFVKLRLERRLPPQEARVLLLGWQIPTPEGEHPGVTYHVLPIELLSIVRAALDGLGVVLDERCGAEGGNQ